MGEYNRSIQYLLSAINFDESECGYYINLGHSYEARLLPNDTEVCHNKY